MTEIETVLDHEILESKIFRLLQIQENSGAYNLRYNKNHIAV